jgi:glycosyltransferase involved in cell wall biosynthesis
MDRFSMLIEYLRVISNEIVIVDTGSEAADIAIMESWSDRFEKGVKVIETAWEDDFSKARNVGLAECTAPWTLVLDPDEIPSVGMISHISMVLKGEVARENAVGWAYWTVNYWGGVKGPEENYHWHCRLFRTGRGKFYRPVHELVALDGRLESETRGTVTMPLANPVAYLIHSKAKEELEKADELYEKIGERSR